MGVDFSPARLLQRSTLSGTTRTPADGEGGPPVISNTANVTVGEQITDVLGEVLMDLPPSRPWRHHVVELRLMAAVLEDALNVLPKRPRSRAGREARAWVPP